jgi:hypothetical protein
MIKTAFANSLTESGPERHGSKGMLASPFVAARVCNNKWILSAPGPGTRSCSQRGYPLTRA